MTVKPVWYYNIDGNITDGEREYDASHITNVRHSSGRVVYGRNCLLDLINALHEENEQLKEQNIDWETTFNNCKHYKEAYGTEIVKIKQTIKDMMGNERTELGRSVLKQLWEAIQ